MDHFYQEALTKGPCLFTLEADVFKVFIQRTSKGLLHSCIIFRNHVDGAGLPAKVLVLRAAHGFFQFTPCKVVTPIRNIISWRPAFWDSVNTQLCWSSENWGLSCIRMEPVSCYRPWRLVVEWDWTPFVADSVYAGTSWSVSFVPWSVNPQRISNQVVYGELLGQAILFCEIPNYRGSSFTMLRTFQACYQAAK